MVTKLDLDVAFDRQTFSSIAHWLLNREKDKNIANIISIIIAYTCNHHHYLIGPKGSALVTFMEDIEAIVGEKIVND